MESEDSARAGIPDDAMRMRVVDPGALSRNEAYRLLISCVVPRPIAWVSTIGANGVANAAPFSFFGGVTSNPPMISISVGRREGEKKDTWRNIEESGEFVVNVVTEELGEAMALTSGDFAPDVSEFQAAGLTAIPSDLVRPPRIAESPIQMECRAVRIVEVGRGPDALILGEVVRIHFRDGLLADGEVDPKRLRALGRLGGARYCRTTDLIEHVRPSIERRAR